MPLRLFSDFSFLMFLLLSTEQATAQRAGSLPDVDVDAVVEVDESGAPRFVRGEMHIRGWSQGDGGCLYLPYEDADNAEERGTKRRFEDLSAKSAPETFVNGSLSVQIAAPGQLVFDEPAQVARLKAALGTGGDVGVSFRAEVPRLASSDPDDWFYDGFLPKLMARCLAPGLDPAYYRNAVAAHYRGTLKLPDGWDYVGPGVRQPDGLIRFEVTGRTLAFALGRKLLRRDIVVDGVPVEIVHRSAGFDGVAETVEHVLPVLIKMLGPYPYDSLKIMETTELQKHGLPGLIAINKPAQAAFSSVQKDWLNWRHWILTVQLARQWYGGAVAPASPDDEWLISGIVEFAALTALSSDERHYNLFAARRDGTRFLSFDYLQFAEVSAAMLETRAPFAVLTTDELVSRDPLRRQHPLLFERQAFAMRQLMSLTGEEPFYGFLRGLTAAHRDGVLSPKEFFHQVGALPSPFSPGRRAELQQLLRRWWTEEGWPDFTLKDTEAKDMGNGHYQVTVRAEQQGTVDFPPMFSVEDGNGQVTYVRAKSTKVDNLWIATVETAYYPERVVVDPKHEAFDGDRFDNDSDGAGVRFFPGSTNTLSDSDYTLGWLPYAFRRPGEPFSLGVQAALLRYVKSALSIQIESSPSEKDIAYRLRQSYQLPSVAMTTSLSLKQTYDHDREAEAIVTRMPIIDAAVRVGASLHLRHKDRVGDQESRHGTVGFGLDFKPAARSRACGYRLSAEIEHAPESLAHGFSYERVKGALAGDCNLSTRINLGTRIFAGSLYRDGTPPEQALFKVTDLQEARLRLDIRGLARVRKISTISTDLLLPFYVPIPSDAMILARQMRWRLFYDFGRSYDKERLDYRSYGLGFLLPFGGDLAGAGSLAFTRISILAIMESRVNQDVEKKPSVVFDVTGEL